MKIAPVLALLWTVMSSSSLQVVRHRGDETGMPVETSVCKILSRPFVFDNKLVRVRGYVDTSDEYSVLLDEQCPDNGIWFKFAGDSAPPGLVATVEGSGEKQAKSKSKRRIAVRLVRDASFEELQRYWAISQKGHACTEGPPPASFPECTTYRVTATFVGRIDSVSRKVYAERARQKHRDNVDWKGFGHVGLFDAQIVAESVERVVAEDQSVAHKRSSNSPQ